MSYSHKKSAFIAFVRDHQAQLRSFIRMLGAHPDAVDDLAQEVFLTAYEKLEHYDETRDLDKWLRGVARNKVMNELNKQSRRMKIQSETLYAHLKAMTDEDNNEGIFLEEYHEALSTCLEDLPEKSQRIVKDYYYQEGAKSKHIAAKLAMSHGAVRLSLMRIRKTLKTCIENRLKHGY